MDNNATAERIKELLMQKNMTAKQMLLDLGLSSNYLTMMRRAKYVPDKLGLIADYLGVSTDYLLGTEQSAPAYDEKTQRIIDMVGKMTEEQKDALLNLFAPDND